MNAVDEVGVRVAVEELHECGPLDRHLERLGVAVEVKERGDEIDPDRRVGLAADLLEGRAQGVGGKRLVRRSSLGHPRRSPRRPARR
jgi:hypothetical protein